jgi:predicted GNAT superfamily acetyltransferase
VTATGVEIRTVSEISELAEVGEVLQEVWGTSSPLVSLELARAIAHSGGYVAAAFAPSGQMIGASVGILARHGDRSALHSHVTGLLRVARHGGTGRAMKLHQRAWAVERSIEFITWTFDPLVRRNAWFNIAVLGAEADEYLPSFYGEMTDAINAGDDSDRLHVTWDVTVAMPERLRDGSDVDPLVTVPTPDDIVELRRTDPAAVALWRRSTREALVEALGRGHRIVGFTRDGAYVIGSVP